MKKSNIIPETLKNINTFELDSNKNNYLNKTNIILNSRYMNSKASEHKGNYKDDLFIYINYEKL